MPSTLSRATVDRKLALLAAAEGFRDVHALLTACQLNRCSPGICVEPRCDHVAPDVEPDQDRGWCELCDSRSVRSALVLAGLI